MLTGQVKTALSSNWLQRRDRFFVVFYFENTTLFSLVCYIKYSEAFVLWTEHYTLCIVFSPQDKKSILQNSLRGEVIPRLKFSYLL
jgi:hypothetical protein